MFSSPKSTFLKGSSTPKNNGWKSLSINEQTVTSGGNELGNRKRELSVLMQMSDFLSSAKDLNLLLSGALNMVISFFLFDAGRIYLKKDDSPYLILAAQQGMEPEGLERIHEDEGFTGRAYRTRSLIVQPVSSLEDKGRVALLMGKGLETIICVPLITADKVGGVMNLASGKTVTIDQHESDLLSAMGNQIAIAANHARLYNELNHKLQTLREKKEMIKFFAFSVSHDLKSPAIGLYGLARRLKEKYSSRLDEKGRTYCDQILTTAEHIVNLVDRINVYISTRESPLNPEWLDLHDILTCIREEFSDTLTQRDVRFILPKTNPHMLADKISLIRLFRNLSDNSLKYGGKTLSEVKIACNDERGFHVIFFSDDGIGIPPEEHDRIFEAFHRNSSSHDVAGSGLGLSIAKETIERHGGSISVENRIGGGTTFRIEIPKVLKKEERK
jgi:signal transduction histidine kinase